MEEESELTFPIYGPEQKEGRRSKQVKYLPVIRGHPISLGPLLSFFLPLKLLDLFVLHFGCSPDLLRAKASSYGVNIVEYRNSK